MPSRAPNAIYCMSVRKLSELFPSGEGPSGLGKLYRGAGAGAGLAADGFGTPGVGFHAEVYATAVPYSSRVLVDRDICKVAFCTWCI